MSNTVRDKKMRIALLDPEHRVISDKLVMQDPEMYSGPKLQHSGPITLEVSIWDAKDVENVKAYLDKLTGTLPLDTPKKRVPKSVITGEEEDLQGTVLTLIKNSTTQEELIKGLRDQGFTFLSSQFIDYLSEKDGTPWKWAEEAHSKYQFLILQLKEAKNPLADKYDFRTAIGIDLSGKSPGILLYTMAGQEVKKIKKDWASPEAVARLRKKAMSIFPVFMSEEEREKFRLILRKHKLEMPLSALEEKFFNRWNEWVKQPE